MFKYKIVKAFYIDVIVLKHGILKREKVKFLSVYLLFRVAVQMKLFPILTSSILIEVVS